MDILELVGEKEREITKLGSKNCRLEPVNSNPEQNTKN